MLSCFLYVLFGQITVRKLRKNPKTQSVLGANLISGWDIINVAEALACPEFLAENIRKSSLSFLYANSKVQKF